MKVKIYIIEDPLNNLGININEIAIKYESDEWQIKQQEYTLLKPLSQARVRIIDSEIKSIKAISYPGDFDDQIACEYNGYKFHLFYGEEIIKTKPTKINDLFKLKDQSALTVNIKEST